MQAGLALCRDAADTLAARLGPGHPDSKAMATRAASLAATLQDTATPSPLPVPTAVLQAGPGGPQPFPLHEPPATTADMTATDLRVLESPVTHTNAPTGGVEGIAALALAERDVVAEGWLVKRGAVVPTWRRRFFVLRRSGACAYYADAACTQPRGAFECLQLVVGPAAMPRTRWPGPAQPELRVAMTST